MQLALQVSFKNGWLTGWIKKKFHSLKRHAGSCSLCSCNGSESTVFYGSPGHSSNMLQHYFELGWECTVWIGALRVWVNSSRPGCWALGASRFAILHAVTGKPVAVVLLGGYHDIAVCIFCSYCGCMKEKTNEIKKYTACCRTCPQPMDYRSHQLRTRCSENEDATIREKSRLFPWLHCKAIECVIPVPHKRLQCRIQECCWNT
jgi:hypothetical protein